MIRLSQLTTVVSFCTLALACGGSSTQPADEQLNIGETEVLGESLSDYVATWQGYAEAYDFAGEGDTVFLQVNGDGDGYLRVGDLEATLVPPATDPLAYYPSSDGFKRFPDIPPGYELGFENAMVASNRLQLTARVRPMDSWCAMQTSYVWASHPSGYGCLPYRDARPAGNVCYQIQDDQSEAEISCVLMWGCLTQNQQCNCDANGCVGAQEAEVKIDAVLEDDGETLTGTMVADNRITIRLTRVD